MSYDIHVRVRLSPVAGRYTVELRAPDGQTEQESVDLVSWYLAQFSKPVSIETGALLASLLWSGRVGGLLSEAIASKPPDELGRILFDYDARLPQFIPWETVTLGSQTRGSSFIFVRWSDAEALLSLEPPSTSRSVI